MTKDQFEECKNKARKLKTLLNEGNVILYEFVGRNGMVYYKVQDIYYHPENEDHCRNIISFDYHGDSMIEVHLNDKLKDAQDMFNCFKFISDIKL